LNRRREEEKKEEKKSEKRAKVKYTACGMSCCIPEQLGQYIDLNSICLIPQPEPVEKSQIMKSSKNQQKSSIIYKIKI
jgi:hypothetical protein